MTLPLNKPAMIDSTVLPKWTIRNDEWVQVYCEIMRGPKGLSDRPAALTAIAQTGAKV